VAVDHVSFSVHEAEIFGVLGPNGSGKSTLIRLIATLLLPDAGSITVFGHDVVSQSMQVQRLINRVSVEASFFKKLSPMENLLYGARLYGMEGKETRRKVDEPTTGLDPRSKHEVQAVIRELNEQHGTTIVLTTHDMGEAEALCHRIAIVDNGKIVALDAPEALKKLIPRNGHEPTLEDVFLELTGNKLVSEEEEEG
jgi:ABC-2 type transport system ATP-binding protein